MILKNKKAISEITSFMLITLLVIIASTAAYIFSKNLIDENLITIDNKNMDIYLKKSFYNLNEITSFDGSSKSMSLSFKTGRLNFENNSIIYYSLGEYLGDSYCGDVICYDNLGGYEKKSIALPNSYIFSNNMSLMPGTYTILLKNIKNESKIFITFR